MTYRTTTFYPDGLQETSCMTRTEMLNLVSLLDKHEILSFVVSLNISRS